MRNNLPIIGLVIFCLLVCGACIDPQLLYRETSTSLICYVLQGSGKDPRSVWADPRLGDPQHGDYALGPDSPALNLGIQQITLDNFGIQNTVVSV